MDMPSPKVGADSMAQVTGMARPAAAARGSVATIAPAMFRIENEPAAAFG